MPIFFSGTLEVIKAMFTPNKSFTLVNISSTSDGRFDFIETILVNKLKAWRCEEVNPLETLFSLRMVFISMTISRAADGKFTFV